MVAFHVLSLSRAKDWYTYKLSGSCVKDETNQPTHPAQPSPTQGTIENPGAIVLTGSKF